MCKSTVIILLKKSSTKVAYRAWSTSKQGRSTLNRRVTRCVLRVGLDHLYTKYKRYFWQGNHQIYGHTPCIHTGLADPAQFVPRVCKEAHGDACQTNRLVGREPSLAVKVGSEFYIAALPADLNQ